MMMINSSALLKDLSESIDGENFFNSIKRLMTEVHSQTRLWPLLSATHERIRTHEESVSVKLQI